MTASTRVADAGSAVDGLRFADVTLEDPDLRRQALREVLKAGQLIGRFPEDAVDARPCRRWARTAASASFGARAWAPARAAGEKAALGRRARRPQGAVGLGGQARLAGSSLRSLALTERAMAVGGGKFLGSGRRPAPTVAAHGTFSDDDVVPTDAVARKRAQRGERDPAKSGTRCWDGWGFPSGGGSGAPKATAPKESAKSLEGLVLSINDDDDDENTPLAILARAAAAASATSSKDGSAAASSSSKGDSAAASSSTAAPPASAQPKNPAFAEIAAKYAHVLKDMRMPSPGSARSRLPKEVEIDDDDEPEVAGGAGTPAHTPSAPSLASAEGASAAPADPFATPQPVKRPRTSKLLAALSSAAARPALGASTSTSAAPTAASASSASPQATPPPPPVRPATLVGPSEKICMTTPPPPVRPASLVGPSEKIYMTLEALREAPAELRILAKNSDERIEIVHPPKAA